jgi:iron complex transport system substrate-binding protein
MKRTGFFVCFYAMAFFMLLGLAFSKSIHDCTDHPLHVPERISRAFGTSPIVTQVLYALDPSLLVGLNFPFRTLHGNGATSYMLGVPILGGWFGNGQSLNLESLLIANPQLVLSLKLKGASPLAPRKPETLFKQFGIPHAYLCLDGIQDYPKIFSWLGQALGKEDRAQRLSCFADQSLREAQEIIECIPTVKRPTVYYAEGPDGLRTECDKSQHAWFIPFCGAINVHRCQPSSPIGMEKISLETLYLYDPDVILVQDSTFFQRVNQDPRWNPLKAIKRGRVYRIPDAPFGWLDRPPLSFMGILGVIWLSQKLYPEHFPKDLISKIQAFAEGFLHTRLSQDAAWSLLKP